MTVTIRPATEAELPAVGALIALSFDDLAQNHSLVPDEEARLRVMTGFFTLLTEHAPLYGKVDVIDGDDGGLVAAAVWFDRTQDMPEIRGTTSGWRRWPARGWRTSRRWTRSSTSTTRSSRTGTWPSWPCTRRSRGGAWAAR